MDGFGEVTPQRHYIMSRIRSKDTKPEIMLRKALWKEGYRYRKNFAKLPGSPDIVLTKYRVCIFVDSEFFHGYGWDSGGKERVLRGRNPGYWVRKIERNMERDRAADAKLRILGWEVLHFWGRDVEKELVHCIAAVKMAVSKPKVEDGRHDLWKYHMKV